jgi:hypothetical protein
VVSSVEQTETETATASALSEFAAAGYEATLPAYSQEGFASDEVLADYARDRDQRKSGEFSPSRLADFSFLREALADLKTGK